MSGNRYKYLTASGLVKTGTGILKGITVSFNGTLGDVIIYDNTAGSGTVIAQQGFHTVTSQTANSVSLNLFDVRFNTGCYIAISGGAGLIKVTAIYQ